MVNNKFKYLSYFFLVLLKNYQFLKNQIYASTEYIKIL